MQEAEIPWHLQTGLIWIFTAYIRQKETQSNPLMSDHPKCQDLGLAYGRWSRTEVQPQGVSSEKRSEHILLMEENSLHAIPYSVQFHVYITKSSLYDLRSIVHLQQT